MISGKSFVRVAIIFACALALTATSVAQYRAGVQGTVTDPSGAVVPGATVTLVSNETNRSRSTTTSDSGAYSISGLAPGSYKITVEKQGFNSKTLNVQVGAEQVQGVNVQMELGQAAQTVTVSADVTPAINTESATIAGTITSKDIQTLPTVARDPFKLLQLAPGTFGDNARSAGGGSQNLPGNAGPGGTSQDQSIFQTENQVQVSANGQRTTANSYQIDGVSVNSLAWGGAAIITPNQESVKEVRIESSSYNAENGRAGGAQVLVVSKNGTNDFHGSALLRVARPGLNAFQKWNGPTAAVQRVSDRSNQWAGSFGGPILKNKLFFFFSYETLRKGASTPGTGWYETPQFLSAVQAAKPGSIASKITGFEGEGVSFSSISQTADCANAGITPCTNIFDNSGKLIGLDIGSPLATPLGTRDPTWVSGGAAGVGGGLDGVPDIMFVNTVNPEKATFQQFNGRLDFQATNNDLIAFSMYYVPADRTFFNGPARPANLWNNSRTNQSGTLLWTRTITPTLLNEARISGSGWHWNEVDSNPQEPWGLPQSNIDALKSANVQYFGAPGPSIFAQWTYNFRDTASWMHGNHSLKLGTDIYWEQNNDSQVWNARPQYSFRNLWDFANDAPYKENGNFDPRTGIPTAVKKYVRSKIYAFFVQDDFKVRPNLTLNLGLRWEYFGPITEKNGQISNAVLGTGANTLTDLRLRLGGNLYNSSKNNWGPQIGFAWTPFRDTSDVVIRGGFGIGYTRMEEAITLNGRSNPPFVSNAEFVDSPNILYSVPSDVRQFFDWPANPATVQTFDPTTNLPTTGSVVVNIFPQELPTPTTYRYSLETQYAFPGNWVATVGYQGSQSRHYTRQLNLNWFFPQNRNAALSQVFYYNNDANANYNALLANLKHRFSRSLEVSADYRWGKVIDQGSNEYFIGPYPFDRRFMTGPADYDAAHNFKLFAVWSPRLFPGNSSLEKVLGGWTISGILNWHTGFPFSALYSGTSCNVIYTGSGYCDLLPAAFAGGALDDHSNDVFMRTNGIFPGLSFTDCGTPGNNCYFTLPTWDSNGNIPPPPGVARNSFRGPRYFNTDITLQKAFGLPKMKILGEQAQFEIRADFFNIFNKLNLAVPENKIGFSPTTANQSFGQSQSAFAGRTINLQARFSF